MFSSGRSVSRTVASASAHFSSKAKSFDPRTPEFKKRFVPVDHFEDKRTFSLKKLLHPTMTATEAMKMLTAPIDLNKSIISSWWKAQLTRYMKKLQVYDPKKLEDMGSDISVGHIFLQLGAGLLYEGKPWMKGMSTLKQLPRTFEEGWILEAIDLSNCEIYYEGLCNFQNLRNVHTIIAQNCHHLDDWCLDLLCSEVLGLENLDLSGCKKISPRGLVPLVRLPNLHTLDLSNCPAFETSEGKLMCILIQDLKPNLDIKGINLSEILITKSDFPKSDVSFSVEDSRNVPS